MELFPYQQVGAQFLASRKTAGLFDQMGLGKSAQAITACDLVSAKNILVVCRAVGRLNWANEFRRFSLYPRPIHVLLCPSDYTFTAGSTGIHIVSYEGLPALLSRLGTCGGFRYDVAIVDESHYAKEPKAARTRSVYGTAGIVRKAQRIWCLTGTPCPNHFGELWPMLFTFGATRLGFGDFTEHFCEIRRTGYGDQILGTKTDAKTLDEIHRLLKNVSLRRTKEEVFLEMPEISYQTFAVEASPVDIRSHAGFVRWWLPDLNLDGLNKVLAQEKGIIDGVLANGKMSDALLADIMACAKSVTTLRRYTALQKMQSVIDLINSELLDKCYDKVVIFAIHKDCIEGLRVGLQKFHPLTLYGGTPPEKRDMHIARFQDPKSKYRVMICNINAAGTSINLTAASQVVFLEQAWVPGDNAQAAARCHRIGQTKPVNVRIMALADSIDAKVAKILERKLKEIDLILESDKRVQPAGPLKKKPGRPPKPKDVNDLF